MIEPLILKPYMIRTPWAGNRMKDYRMVIDKEVGIYREVCAYKDESNIWINGPKPDMLLKDALKLYHKEIMGSDQEDEIIRLAYIDTAANLSIQVHPDEQFAEALLDHEKTESWYIIDCAKDAYVIAGTTLKDKVEIRKHILDNTLDNYLIKIPVLKDDLIIIPSGIIHACGKDILALEIGSFGGITFRLYDYERGRKLDIDEGILALNPILRAEKISCLSHQDNKRYNVLVNRLFKIDVIDLINTFHVDKQDHYEILTNVDGLISIIMNERSYTLKKTSSLIIPACQKDYDIIGEGRLLVSYR